jgi:dihydroorotase
MLVIKGGKVVDPVLGFDGVAHIWIEKGVVTRLLDPSLEEAPVPDGAQVVDASGLVVVPGLVDMHVHLREPGYEYKETIRSGTEAAAAGGVTTVACMPNTDPPNDHGAIAEFVVRKAREEGAVRVVPIGAISKGLKGKSLAEIGELKEAGAVALSDDGRPVTNSLLMRRAMEYARTFALPVISHCEDLVLAANGSMNEGVVSLELGLRGIPATAEEVMVARDLALAEWTGCPLHIAHVSTAGSVRMIREARARGVKVTAEATPHHLLLTEDAVRSWDTNTKVNPPLRSDRDVEALQDALRDGTIDVIASDHAPHAPVDKELEYEHAAFGISGVETLASLSLMLVHKGVLSLQEWVRKVSVNPSRILAIEGGTLAPGSRADLTLLDLERTWKIEPDRFRSKGKNSPFRNWVVRGRVEMTVVAGKVVYRAEGA